MTVKEMDMSKTSDAISASVLSHLKSVTKECQFREWLQVILQEDISKYQDEITMAIQAAVERLGLKHSCDENLVEQALEKLQESSLVREPAHL